MVFLYTFSEVLLGKWIREMSLLHVYVQKDVTRKKNVNCDIKSIKHHLDSAITVSKRKLSFLSVTKTFYLDTVLKQKLFLPVMQISARYTTLVSTYHLPWQHMKWLPPLQSYLPCRNICPHLQGKCREFLNNTYCR